MIPIPAIEFVRQLPPIACVLHAGAPRAPGLEKSTQKITLPSQQTLSGSPRAADNHGIQVTSHPGQVIRLPTSGTPRMPQFQHSLGSAFCWLPLICFPPQLFPYDPDLRPGGTQGSDPPAW